MMGGHGLGVGVVVALACVLAAAPLDAGVVEATIQADDFAVWSGFAPDFEPNWQGDTTTITTLRRIRRPGEIEISEVVLANIFDIGGTIFHYNDIYNDIDYWNHPPRLLNRAPSRREQRWTVNRVDSSTVTRAGANASVDYQGTPYSASIDNESGGARYAEIVTDRGWLLADGSAIALQDANLGDRSLSAEGCFSAEALLARRLVDGAAESWGNSGFSATYSLEEATVFSLSLDLALWGDAELSFRALDDLTGEALFTCETVSGLSRHLDMTGILDAGQYTFELSGNAYAQLDSTGGLDIGGMASYNVALDFAAESYWVTVGGDDANENGCIVYADRVFEVPEAPGSDVFFAWNYTGSTITNNFWAIDSIKISPPAVPEPATPTLLLLGMLAALALFRRK